MPRTVRLGLALAALALVATGCASATVAADVDGVKIDDGQAIALGGIDDSGSRVNGDDFRSALSLLVIQQSLGKAAAADFGLPDYTTPEGRTAFLEQASQSQIDTVGNEIEAGVADGRDPDAVETFVVSQVAISTEVREAILHSDEFLSSLWDDDRDVLAGVCASHILVATEAEAQDVIARIDAGEDFGDVADEVSLDTASAGGVLPCPTPISSLITEFAEAVT
ncbi:MAG: hypothetical protein KDB69_07960, partial [Acidimicrobiia bacterium]|nr:hypothetical protein [Acidimicrobiia bacterium]